MGILTAVAVLTSLLLFVTLLFYSSFSNARASYYFKEYPSLEIMLTLVPSVFLFSLAIPSLASLYALEFEVIPDLTIRVVGKQWLWQYQYDAVSWNSFILSPLRSTLPYLSTDTSLLVPAYTLIKLHIASLDVIHSFAVPSLALKIDAIPGRIHSVCFSILREGLFLGQCSELCGLGHPLMPIQLVAVHPYLFFSNECLN